MARPASDAAPVRPALHVMTVTTVLLAAWPAAAAGDAVRGESLFQRCYACHSLDPAETGLPGPNLHGVIGRRAASLPDFAYSTAMTAQGQRGLVWTRKTLDRYLQDPEAMVPGTLMAVNGLPDASDRDDLIAYLCQAGAGDYQPC